MIVVMVIMVMMVSQEEGKVVERPTVHLVMVMVMKVKSLGWINTPFEQEEQHTGTPKSSMMLRMWMGAQQARKSSSITSRAMLGAQNTFSVFFNFPFIHFFQTSIIFKFPGSIVLPGVSLASSFRKSPSYNLRSDGQSCLEILCGS